MILLDTNVVSEPMKPKASEAVLAWIDRQGVDTMYFTAIGLAELLIGVELIPAGRRKRGLAAATREFIERCFGPRILPFNQQAASAYAVLVSRARLAGHTISVADGQIAAIAHIHGFTIATRDTAPFVAAGLTVLNPWQG